ncbi:DUF6491 family protein [Pseudokordiimonas caeni]|uniref:DUF6491 family protein n=1 Tax=Pseudokordiimonas caeni TaxID=2997908 RepID=UPI002811BF2C|nr:DUF6491 family protein [Pseudokordiimonas caeni]
MKRMFRNVTGLFTLSALALALAAPVMGADDDNKPTRLEKRKAAVMEKYERTGEVKRCVPLRELRSSSILDEKTIFFRTNNARGYLVEMANRCPRLAFEERFAYKTSLGSLCSHDIITVIDSFGRDWASCGLADFQVMKRRETPAEDGTVDSDADTDADTDGK